MFIHVSTFAHSSIPKLDLELSKQFKTIRKEL